MNLRKFAVIITILLYLLCLGGCQESERTILVVKFKNDSSLKYRMVSDRKVEIDLDGSEGKAKPSMVSEKLELVMSYAPVGQVDPYGITTMKATCGSAKVTRKSSAGRVLPDVAEELTGRSFNFTISPTGKVLDYSEMDALVFELGKRSIIEAGTQGRIKHPDMVADFIALQRHLWDSVASVDQGSRGAKDGQRWKTLEYIPLPIPVRATKETTYTLAGGVDRQVDPEGAERKVEIRSTLALSKEKIMDWPRLYEGSFRMRGMFGFLRNYRFISLEGTGVQIFNVDAGVVESDEQEYRVLMEASLPMALNADPPLLTVDQKMKIEILTE